MFLINVLNINHCYSILAESDEESYSPVCSDEEEDEDENESNLDTSSHLYNNPNANSNDHTIIMNLLDLAARSEEDSILIEDEEEVSQGKCTCSMKILH